MTEHYLAEASFPFAKNVDPSCEQILVYLPLAHWSHINKQCCSLFWEIYVDSSKSAPERVTMTLSARGLLMSFFTVDRCVIDCPCNNHASDVLPMTFCYVKLCQHLI